jgi:DNA end-binding protein Ku
LPRAKKAKAAAGEQRSPEELLEVGAEEGEPRARPFWSGTISFGLVTIPVDLYSATRSTRSSLRMLSPSGTPVARRYFDPKGKPLDSEQLERGYELDKGEFVVVSDEELEALAPEQSRDIDLTRFVDRDSIPPLFFERAYILAPSGNSNLAYRLLASTLERTKRAGIASFVMRGKQYVVAIVAEQGLLRAETLRFAAELRTPDAVGLPEPVEPSAQKVKSLRAAIHKEHGGSPTASELADEYWKRLEALVKKKHKSGEDIVNPEPIEEEQENLAEVIDLVAVLRKSLGQTGAASTEDSSASEQKSAGEARSKNKGKSSGTGKDSGTPRESSRKSTAGRSVKRAPAKRAPAKRAPTKRTPTKRAPAKRAPAKRTASKRRAS